MSWPKTLLSCAVVYLFAALSPGRNLAHLSEGHWIVLSPAIHLPAFVGTLLLMRLLRVWLGRPPGPPPTWNGTTLPARLDASN